MNKIKDFKNDDRKWYQIKYNHNQVNEKQDFILELKHEIITNSDRGIYTRYDTIQYRIHNDTYYCIPPELIPACKNMIKKYQMYEFMPIDLNNDVEANSLISFEKYE
jgi:hypothetical protein